MKHTAAFLLFEALENSLRIIEKYYLQLEDDGPAQDYIMQDIIEPARQALSKAKESQGFEYMLLARLKVDCESYFNDNQNHLWGVDPKEHANKMLELYDLLEIKPEWLSVKELFDWVVKLNNV